MRAFRAALKTIVTNDGPQATAGTIRNLCGRDTKVLVGWRALRKAALPVIGYVLVSDIEAPRSHKHREVLVQLSIFADENTGGVGKVDDIDARLRAILTQPAFEAAGIDAAPVGPFQARDMSPDEEELEIDLERKDLDVLFHVRLP